jgi:hypothetical protein
MVSDLGRFFRSTYATGKNMKLGTSNIRNIYRAERELT